MHTKRKMLFFVPALIWMAVIFWFSSNNGDASSSQSSKVSYIFASAADQAFRLDMSDAERMNFSERISFLVRKTAHFSEYFILGMLLYTAIGINFGKTLDLIDESMKILHIFRIRYILPVIIVFGYAGTDELHQYFVPDRCCSFKDVLIDTAGGLASVLMIIFIRYVRSRKAYNTARRSVQVEKDENM